MARWRVAYSQGFFETLGGCAPSTRKRVFQHMRYIQDDPARTAPTFRDLPPMHAPGSREATFGEIVIRYFVRYDDVDGAETTGEIRFLRVIFHED